MTSPITTALVLSAGFGKRMRPLTDTIPKPLVPLDGKPLIDHVLDRLADTGITRAICNVHYLAEKLETHLASRQSPHITISDERDNILDTGGAVVRARHAIGNDAFLIHNSDSVWIETGTPNLKRLIDGYDSVRMDCLLLLAPIASSLGYDGHGDFHLEGDGKITRQSGTQPAPYVFAGASITSPYMFNGEVERAFSLNHVWDRGIAAGRLYGIILDGLWMHVGTPDALADAEAAIANHRNKRL